MSLNQLRNLIAFPAVRSSSWAEPCAVYVNMRCVGDRRISITVTVNAYAASWAVVQSRGLTAAQILPLVAVLTILCRHRLPAAHCGSVRHHPCATPCSPGCHDTPAGSEVRDPVTDTANALQPGHAAAAHLPCSPVMEQGSLAQLRLRNTRPTACLHGNMQQANHNTSCLPAQQPCIWSKLGACYAKLLHSNAAGMPHLRCRTVSGFTCPHGIRRQIQQLPLDTVARGDLPALKSLCWRRLVGAIPAQDAPLVQANLEDFPYVLLLFEVTLQRARRL